MGTTRKVRVAVLGPLVLDVRGVPLRLPAPKERAVVEALALSAGRPVRPERIAAALWGERPPRNWRKSVQVHVWRLRRRLEGLDAKSTLRTADDGYVLDVDTGDVDVLRAERLIEAGRDALAGGDPREAAGLLAEALALWRGAPLEDLADDPSTAVELRRLAELRLSATEDLNEAELALGRHDSLPGRIEEQLGTEPLRERLWGQLMLALYRAGRQAEALRAYQRARAVLVDEVGIEPGPELRRIEHAIVTHDAWADPASRSTRPIPEIAPRGNLPRWACGDALGRRRACRHRGRGISAA